ncbi:toprim domain protein [Clostridiales bacterium oral taxon 876 str. F0540]|nr:toprim domain protein [Clostridiales bacterium oral taxon 876 str. F0540]
MTREKLRFADEQIAQADSINIISYAQSSGYPVKQVTPRSFKIEGYGGLYIHSDGHKWNWFSQNKGGGAIQFVMEIENKTWVEAIKHLLGISREVVRYMPPIVEKENKEKGEFVLPEKNNTFKHIFAYLINSRGIDKEIVYDFVKKHKIYENKYKSCVFVGSNKEGQAKYASIRSTNTTGSSFRCDVKNSDKTYPFCKEGSNDTVCVFEAPIDLLSYLTLIKKHNVLNFESHCISLGGVSDKALEYYLNENPNIKKIMLCLDNDEAGHFACQQIREKYRDRYKIVRHLPEGKDFNEQLLNMSKAYPKAVENNAANTVAEEEMFFSQ